ncbi:MAG: protein meaA, partial [Leptospiraceae bacterium]|nr:protein meaA [Leptospiraceae bacterium]
MSTTEAHKLYNDEGEEQRDRPWIFRTYAGHSNARASNELYRRNLAAGQTGLSIAFDLPTQCGYSSNHPIARPEIGKVGVPINSLDDFHILFEEIPLEQMNTSMTINGTSMWLLALYVALARERGNDISKLQGTTQNDIVKEYLARGTYIFPPQASMRIIAEMYEYCLANIPKWNASNICSYHLQEAGATPAQELAFALANAIGILDILRERGQIHGEEFEKVVGRISFFVNSGIRFIEEMCKMRAFTGLWDEITLNRYGVANPRYRRFRYGVQVNSLGLTEAQPENNAWRILIETLGVTMSRNARCRALQLPAWNEALSLPRPWDQQWSLRLQQILAYETDLLEYPDLFDGSPVIESKVNALKAEAQAEIDRILGMGGVQAAIESGYMKTALVKSMSNRVSDINSGELIVVGLNKWTDGLPSPLTAGDDGGIFKVDEEAARITTEQLERTIANRDANRAEAALQKLKEAANNGTNMMEASIECALARVTTGEWADALREVFGEYRPVTGIEGQKLSLEDDRVVRLRNRV